MTDIPVLPQKFPYNEMLLRDQRQFETRNWDWKYRGPILLYTSSTNVSCVVKAYGYDPKAYPHQVIVARAKLVDVRALKRPELVLTMQQLNPGISKREITDFLRYSCTEYGRVYPGFYGFFFEDLKRIVPTTVNYPRGAVNMFWLRGTKADKFLK